MEGTKRSVKRMLTRARNALTVFLSKKENTPKEYVSMETLEACFRDGTLTKNKIRGIGKETISLLETMFPAVEDIKIGGQSMTEKEYNEAEGIRRSDLWKMEDSPEKFKYFLEHPVEQTPAMAFGSACHKWVLEGDEFWDEYEIAPNVDKRTKEGKETWAKFVEENAGKSIISNEDFLEMDEMAGTIHNCKLAEKLIFGKGESEVPFFWTDPDTGEKCKIKVDRLVKYNRKWYVVDYKTTQCAETFRFNSDIWKLGYFLQAYMYTEGVMVAKKLKKRPGFLFVAQEKKAPYSVNVIEVTEEVMNAGCAKFKQLMEKYHQCKVLDQWPGYLNGNVPNDAFLPNWMQQEMEDDFD